MKRLNITKEAYDKSKYFTSKYGKLEYVSESGNIFKTDKGKILKFNESPFGGYTPDELEDELQKYEKEQDGIDASKKRKQQKVVDVVKPEIKEGTILCSIWGYSMTLVDFYEVKRRIGSSTLEIVRLKKTETGGGMMGETTPVEGEYSGEPFKVRFNKYGKLKADGSKYLEIWNGKPQYYNRMDESIKNESDDSEDEEFESDGWELDDCDSWNDVWGALYDLNYEISNCVRGCYTGCNTYQELADYIESLSSDLSNAANDIRYIQ